jgi:sulfur-carrier protein
MTITLKYFGSLVDITQKKEEQYIFGENKMSVAYLKAKLEIFYGDLKQTNFTIAVNQKMVGLDYLVQDQDIIAFLPPFAGG